LNNIILSKNPSQSILLNLLSFYKRRKITMEISALTAISPVDGRYSNKVDNLWKYFSEFALIKYRVFVEIEYFIALHEIQLPQLTEISASQIAELRKIT
jgi:adenylosuccinate lyase